MQVGSLFASNSGNTGFTAPRSASGSSAVASESSGSAKNGGPPDTTSEAFREVLSRYDVRSISPRDYSAMLGELRSKGAIDDDQLRLLSLVRLELDATNQPADEPLNLLEFFSERLQKHSDELERTGEKATSKGLPPADSNALLASSRDTLEWLEKFARVAEGVEPGSIDLAV